jgi:hypothetical protein
MDGMAVIRSMLAAEPCTPGQLWEAYQTAMPEASRIGMSFDLKALAERGAIHLREGVWIMSDPVTKGMDSPEPSLASSPLRDLEQSFAEWLQFGKEWIEQGQKMMQDVAATLAEVEKERANMQKDRDRLLKVRDALYAASVHLELEDEPLDGIKRTWAIKP